ncbi:MAG: hypothetical protein HY391_02690 [Deltaproteobacteria bacterium]|nr:hypothetical protein [Deltaproteobacteria bacterium]
MQEDGEWRKLKGVLTLPLGDFRSHEYLIYEYEGNEEIRANPQTGALQFNGTPQGLTLQDMRYMEHEMGGRPMKMLMGKVRTPFGAVIGNLNLDLQDPLKMEAVPIFKKGGGITDNAASFNILPLAGEYTGLCQKGNVELLLLQIETARGMNELEEERVTSPFGAYHITGRLGRRCDTSDSTCIWQAYESGTYNFFTGQLFLTGAKLGNPDNSRDLLCQVDGNTILCDKCRFAKVEEGAQKSAPHLTPTASSREFHLELPESPKVTELSSLKEMRGSFFGYLHHEQLDQYQALRLDVRAYYSTDFGMMQIPRPQIEGVAHLFFGTPGNSQHGEPLTYAFRPRPFLDSSSRHTDQKNGLTFSDEERGIFLVIEEWKKESIRGVWYSHTRGRIGTIELLRGEELPLLPPEAVSIPSIEGGYLAGEGDQPATHHLLELKSHPFFNAEFQPHNPYFPLTLTGDLKFFSHDGLVYTDPVIFGSYDFYTGHVALLLDAGKGHRMLTGRISPKGKLLLSLPSAPANGAVIQNHRLSLVR